MSRRIRRRAGVGARTAAVLAAGLLLSACGGSASTPTASGQSPSNLGSGKPPLPVCAPLNRYLVAGRLLERHLSGQDRRTPVYLQHVVDSGIAGLQQAKAAIPGAGATPPTAPADLDAVLQYWTSLRITLAGDGFDVARLTPAQDETLGGRGRLLDAPDAADRIAAYADATCGPTVEPTPQQLADFS